MNKMIAGKEVSVLRREDVTSLVFTTDSYHHYRKKAGTLCDKKTGRVIKLISDGLCFYFLANPAILSSQLCNMSRCIIIVRNYEILFRVCFWSRLFPAAIHC